MMMAEVVCRGNKVGDNDSDECGVWCKVQCSSDFVEFVRLSIAFVNIYIYLTVLGFDWRFSEFKEMNEI